MASPHSRAHAWSVPGACRSRHRFTTFDCSLGKPTSQSKNTKMALVYKCFAVKNGFYRYEPFSLEETLVTVSPCEFPPRTLITCVLSVISRNYNGFCCPVFPRLIKSPYKPIYYFPKKKHGKNFGPIRRRQNAVL